MPTSYTSLLGLALPVTGELAGQWGTTVNDYITQYVDSSVAGTQTISGSQTAVTLSVTNGSSLVTAGSGSTGSAQFQIINCTGNPAGLLTITAPASSRQYIIINATSTSQSVKIVGTGPTTGVTILSGEKAHVAWNGSDFVKIATQSGNGDFVTVDTTNLEVTNIKAKDGTAAASIADSTGKITVTQQMTIDGIEVGQGAGNVSTNTAVGVSALAANTTGDENAAFGHTTLNATTTGSGNAAFGSRVLRANTTGNFNTALGYATLLNSTTGSYNTSVGASALQSNTTANYNTAVGYQAAYLNTTGYNNAAFGTQALYANTTGFYNTAIGDSSFGSNTTGSYNTAVGRTALYSNTTASNNTAVGYQAGYTNATGTRITAVGFLAAKGGAGSAPSYSVAVGSYALTAVTSGDSNTAVGDSSLSQTTTGSANTAVGQSSLTANTTGSQNTALGLSALQFNTTASNNTAVGYQAGYSNATGADITAVGYQAYRNGTASYQTAIGFNAMGSGVVTGTQSVAIGRYALGGLTSGNDNVAVGDSSLGANTTGSQNTALGRSALQSNTTASNNTAVGYQAGYANTTGTSNTFLGYTAGVATTTGNYNTLVGRAAGLALTTGSSNTFVGGYDASTGGSGAEITTGSNNTILGAYNGNQGGLDIRTASNYIVLSDGDGNPMAWFDGSAFLHINNTNNRSGTSIYYAGNDVLNLHTGVAAGNVTSLIAGWNSATATTTGTLCLNVTSNGNITNTNNSYGAISDIKLKENIVDATPKLEKLCQVRVVNYNFKEGQTHKQIGVIAQELEQVFPAMVEETPDFDEDGNALGTNTKTVKMSVFTPMLIKAIQELKSELDSVKAELATLKGN